MWTLNWGIHHRTLVSRDSGEPIKNLASEEVCRDEALKLRRQFKNMGYSIWYANAISPEGKTIPLHGISDPYER